jgi:integrase
LATEWRDADGSLAALQAILGHSSVKVTEIYGTISDGLVEREAQEWPTLEPLAKKRDKSVRPSA